MKSVDAHLADILGAVQPVEPISVGLLEARDCLLAELVTAPDALPAFDNSAVDGYAVRFADLAGAGEDAPVTLPVIADIAAGSSGFFSVRRGMCTRIMTGAPLPAGADAVVPVEWTDGGTSRVQIRHQPKEGQGVRRRAEDVEQGEEVLHPGRRLGAAQIGLLAAVGRSQVRVRPRPRVVVLSTGSELVEPGDEIGPGQLVDANSYTLTAAAQEAGCVAYRYGVVNDDPRALLGVIEDQLIRADAVVTSGGVSMGAYDVVKEVLAQLGTVNFERVAMQPGMPQGFGTVGPNGTPIFTLPGNPVSAYVSFQVFVRPALRCMAGTEPDGQALRTATLAERLTSPQSKRSFARAWLSPGDGGQPSVRPVGGHGSHLLADLAAANALVVVPEDTTEVAAGSDVDVMMLEDGP